MNIRHGLTGNYYATSYERKELVDLCNKIGKSVGSIYFNRKYKCYAIRVKNQKQKDKLKILL